MTIPAARYGRALLLAMVGAAFAIVPAAAAAIPKLDIELNGGCVGGPWPDGTNVRFTLKSSGGAVKDTKLVQAEEGEAVGCFGSSMKAGDKVVVKVGTTSRTLTVLRLSIDSIDRVADLVKGKAPTGASVKITINRCGMDHGFSRACPDALVRSRTGAQGSYALDTTGNLNLRGADFVDVRLKNAAGDRFRAQRAVPVFFVAVGSSFIDGVMPSKAAVPFQLLDAPGGVEIATASLVDDAVEFKDGSDPVTVSIGNRIIGSFASDAKMTVPAMITDVDVATDVVTATCFAGKPWLLNVFGATGGSMEGVAGAGGAISVDTTAEGVDIQSGNDVRLECMSSAGDSIRHGLTLP